jgi:hypothetical protein
MYLTEYIATRSSGETPIFGEFLSRRENTKQNLNYTVGRPFIQSPITIMKFVQNGAKATQHENVQER